MPQKKAQKLPPNVRRHGSKFRAVVERDGVRDRSPVMETVEKVQDWLDTYNSADDRPAGVPLTLTLNDGLKLIIADLKETGGRQATHDFYSNHAKILFAGLGGGSTQVHRVTTAMLRRYVDARRAESVSPQTIVSKELFVLKRMLKLAKQAGYILPGDPFASLRLPRWRTGRFDVLTKERIADLVAKMRADERGKAKWHADLVELLFATGIRRAELERLRVADIDLEAGRMAIDGKTGHRYQPFGASLRPVLERLITAALPDGRLISSHRTIEKMFERWKRRLGEPRFTTHTLRHSYATAMASLVGPYELMALMGHASLTQTSRYYHGRADAVRGALDSLRLDPPAQEPSAGARDRRRSSAKPSKPRSGRARPGTARE